MCSYWKSVDDGDLEAVVRGFNKSRNTNSNNNVCSDNHANGGSGNEESYELQKFSCLGFGVETQQQPWFGSTGDVDAVLSAVSGVDCGNYQQAQAPFSLLDLPNNNSNPMFSPTNLFYSCSASSSSSSSAFVLDQGSAASPCSSSAAATAAAAFVADKPKKSEHSGTSAASSSSSSACKAPAQIAKRRKAQQKRTVCVPAATGSNRPSGAEGVPSDLWAWRKYGQKPIKGSPYPRGYYRCSSSKGCSARKQVERSRNDPTMLVITYTSDHNHPWPTHRNALAGSTRQHVSSDKYNTIPLNSFESADVFPEGNQNRLQAEKSQDCNNKKSNFNDDSNQLQSSSPTASASAPDDEITAAASHDDSVFNHHHDDDFFADLGELPDSLFVFAKNPEKERDGKRSEEEAPDEDPLEAFNNWSNSAAFVHLHAKTSQM